MLRPEILGDSFTIKPSCFTLSGCSSGEDETFITYITLLGEYDYKRSGLMKMAFGPILKAFAMLNEVPHGRHLSSFLELRDVVLDSFDVKGLSNPTHYRR